MDLVRVGLWHEINNHLYFVFGFPLLGELILTELKLACIEFDHPCINTSPIWTNATLHIIISTLNIVNINKKTVAPQCKAYAWEKTPRRPS